VKRLLSGAARQVDRVSDAYRVNPTALAVFRIVFGLHALVYPRDFTWPGTMPQEFWTPPLGPMMLFDHIPPLWMLLALQGAVALTALLVTAGFKTRSASFALTVLLIIGNGMTYSFGKIDHTILYSLVPAAMALVGWGAALSLDGLRVGKEVKASGFALFAWGIVAAFALWTAAYPKLRSGWLDPQREATHGYIAREFAREPNAAPFTDFMMTIDSSAFWKLLDWFTLFAEGWLVVAVFFPGLFRLGLLLLSTFHVGVYLTLGIDFSFIAFVYAPFFLLPPRLWFPLHNAFSRHVRSRRPVPLKRRLPDSDEARSASSAGRATYGHGHQSH
jgi:hypothetical protein